MLVLHVKHLHKEWQTIYLFTVHIPTDAQEEKKPKHTRMECTAACNEINVHALDKRLGSCLRMTFCAKTFYMSAKWRFKCLYIMHVHEKSVWVYCREMCIILRL